MRRDWKRVFRNGFSPKVCVHCIADLRNGSRSESVCLEGSRGGCVEIDTVTLEPDLIELKNQSQEVFSSKMLLSLILLSVSPLTMAIPASHNVTEVRIKLNHTIPSN